MESEFESFGGNPAAETIKNDLAEIVLWNERMSPRSQQKTIGPSEIGNECDRRLAYRIAGVPRVNWSDPWPAVVGTAVHNWLEVAVNRFQRENGNHGWVTEVTVEPDPLVRGRSDLFHVPTGTVVDYKTTGTDTMRKLRKGTPPSPGYITQIQLYGLGHERAGRAVHNVCLVYYPRSGWLDDVFVWYAEYDPSIAHAALKRLYGIGFQILDLDIPNHPERFSEITATVGDGCVWCPMFIRELDQSVSASQNGCPGR